MSTRKILTPEQKIAILREHLIKKVPVSEVYDKHGVSVVSFYNWQKQLFENGQAGVAKFVEDYNMVRLHSAIGYVTPQAMLEGRQQAIFDERDRKLAEAREHRAQARAAAREKAASNSPPPPSASYTNSDVAEGRTLLGSNSSAAPLPLTNVGSALSEITSYSAAIASTP